MALPRWLGTVNKHVFNKRELRIGTRPVLHHIGRTFRIRIPDTS